MRNFFAIIFVLILAAGGIFFITNRNSSPQTAVDGTTDVENVAAANADTINDTLLLGDERNSIGSNNATVTIVEFSDFQCPYCKIGSEKLMEIYNKHSDDIRIVFRHFPLSSHPLSQIAAESAEAAGAQDPEKFWEMLEKIFTNQTSLSEDSFAKFAEELNLDVTQYNQDIDSGKYSELVQSDYQDGVSIGIAGTPSFFINGAQANISSFDDLEAQIDAALSK